MKKAFGKVLMALVLLTGTCAFSPVHAEPDFSDTEYWSSYCTQDEYNNSSACDAYREHLSSSSSSLAQSLKDIEAKNAEYVADIAAYKDQIAGYQKQIETKKAAIAQVQATIDSLQNDIDNKQVEINNKQDEIDKTQADIDKLTNKILTRMEEQQSSLRVNKYLDLLMGASSMSDLLRIVSGLRAITESDQATNEELVALEDTQKKQKEELEQAKQELIASQDEQKAAKEKLVSEQQDLLVAQAEVQAAEEAAQQQAALLEAAGAQVSSQISAIKDTLNDVAKRIINSGGISSSAGWTYPVPGARRSAGTWTYPNGGTHLGYDFAAPIGTSIYAVGNGVVINSANGCDTYGYLGNLCGYQYGGSTGGGNQVYLLTAINGNLYAVKYLHMKYGTPIATGTKVSAGQKIGEVGTSGNSSGGHCHIEIFFLGTADNFGNYLSSWDGDLAFGAGWAGSYDGYGRRCDAGYGAPCRIRPESIFGG